MGQAILPKRSLAIMLSASLREIGYVHVKIYRSAKPAQSNLRAGRCRHRVSRNIDLFLMALVVVNIISITVAGKLIAVGSAILGVIVVALITGIVASAFNAQMERRNIIFED